MIQCSGPAPGQCSHAIPKTRVQGTIRGWTRAWIRHQPWTGTIPSQTSSCTAVPLLIPTCHCCCLRSAASLPPRSHARLSTWGWKKPLLDLVRFKFKPTGFGGWNGSSIAITQDMPRGFLACPQKAAVADACANNALISPDVAPWISQGSLAPVSSSVKPRHRERGISAEDSQPGCSRRTQTAVEPAEQEETPHLRTCVLLGGTSSP